MKKILQWIKEHLPRWLDLSHSEPWENPKKIINLNGDELCLATIMIK